MSYSVNRIKNDKDLNDRKVIQNHYFKINIKHIFAINIEIIKCYTGIFKILFYFNNKYCVFLNRYEYYY